MINLQPEARGRTLAAVAATAGCVFSTDHLAFIVIWVVCLVILSIQGELGIATRFLSHIWLPLAIGLSIVWGLIVRGSPQMAAGSSSEAGFEYAAMISLRLAALASIFQASLLSLRGFHLAQHWSRLGFSPEAVAGVMSIFQLWPDFARRTDQVVAARCARGLMTDRKLKTRLKQLPFTFRTLFLSSLGSSLDRATRWQAEGMPERLVFIARSRKNSGSVGGSIFWMAVVMIWLVLALHHHPFFGR